MDTRHHLDIRHNRSLILLLLLLATPPAGPLSRRPAFRSALLPIHRLGRARKAHRLVEHSCPMPALDRRLWHHRLGRGQFCAVLLGQGLMGATTQTAADAVDAFSGHAVERVEDGDARSDGNNCGFYECPETNLDDVP